jgi:hypothetical protein
MHVVESPFATTSDYHHLTLTMRNRQNYIPASRRTLGAHGSATLHVFRVSLQCPWPAVVAHERRCRSAAHDDRPVHRHTPMSVVSTPPPLLWSQSCEALYPSLQRRAKLRVAHPLGTSPIAFSTDAFGVNSMFSHGDAIDRPAHCSGMHRINRIVCGHR